MRRLGERRKDRREGAIFVLGRETRLSVRLADKAMPDDLGKRPRCRRPRFDEAYALVWRELIERLPGAPWQGRRLTEGGAEVAFAVPEMSRTAAR
jgi:hypothetical protein